MPTTPGCQPSSPTTIAASSRFVEPFRELCFGLFQHVVFDSAALAILPVEVRGECARP
jgi:hypothetical protein